MSLVPDVDQVLAIDTEHEEWEADWAEIRIDFAAPDDSVRGACKQPRTKVAGLQPGSSQSEKRQLPL